MRCRKHPADASSTVGVCASCLRERLVAATAAQPPHEFRKSRTQQQSPNSLSFPRSASPRVSRRTSDTARPIRGRLHATPMVETGKEEKQRSGGGSGGGRFSSLFRIFGSKSDSGHEIRSRSCSPWFSAIIPRLRRKQSRAFSVDETAIGALRKARRDRNRGMSPARLPDDECFHGVSSGYSSESSQGWKQTPRMTPGRRGGGRGAGLSRNVSGLGLWLSPLVRPSPNHRQNQKGGPSEKVSEFESRVPAKQLSPAATFCKNKSRKLADFGRHIHTTNR